MAECPYCGHPVNAGNLFCGNCGGRLSTATGLIEKDAILEGRYLIIKMVGRGGMGAVYKALDQRLKNRVVAIKEMSTKAVGPDNIQAAVEAFEHEASMLINLDNPALPRVWDFFQDDYNRLYLVMDFIEGETLEAIVKRRGPIPESEVINWARQICAVLHYLHSHNPPIIFRDLKPANIMLTPKGKIKLIDFGIARHFKPGKTADTVTYGSVGFSAPEQYGQGQTDARSDLYSLGATLYYLLTGINPSKTPFQFEPVSNFVTVSPWVEQAVLRALQLKPDDRPANVQEMLDLLVPAEKDRINDDAPTVLLTNQAGANAKPLASTGDISPTVAFRKPASRVFRLVAVALGLLLIVLAGWFGFSRGNFGTHRDAASGQPSRPVVQPVNEAPVNKPPATVVNQEKKKHPQKVSYQKYSNQRFGFSIDYPKDFTLDNPPANSDGQTFYSPDGKAQLVAFGGNMLPGGSLADIYQSSRVNAGVKVAYERRGDNWFVLSWKKADRIYYQKTFAGGGSANSFIFSYPVSEKGYYDQITIHLESSFRPGNVNKSW